MKSICDKSELAEMHIPGLQNWEKVCWQLFDKKPPQGGHTSHIRSPSGRCTFGLWQIQFSETEKYNKLIMLNRYKKNKNTNTNTRIKWIFVPWKNVSSFCQIQFCWKRVRSVFHRVHLLFSQIQEWQLYFCKKTGQNKENKQRKQRHKWHLISTKLVHKHTKYTNTKS